MKHHVVLLVDSISIPGTYITEEWNIGLVDDNEIPSPYLSQSFEKLTLKEIREALIIEGFVLREFCPPRMIDAELLKEIGGSASLVEIVLSGAAIISMFFFKANGLPKYQKIFELQLPEE